MTVLSRDGVYLSNDVLCFAPRVETQREHIVMSVAILDQEYIGKAGTGNSGVMGRVQCGARVRERWVKGGRA